MKQGLDRDLGQVAGRLLRFYGSSVTCGYFTGCVIRMIIKCRAFEPFVRPSDVVLLIVAGGRETARNQESLC